MIAAVLAALAAAGCRERPPPGAQRGEPCDPVKNRCAAGLFCQAFDFGTAQPPVCAPIPEGGCAEPQRPTCATDGKVYPGTCGIHAAGADVAYSGGCALDAQHIPCGHLVCSRGDYCHEMGACWGPPQRECRPLPEKCKPSPTCECLGEHNCHEQADGSLLVHIPGG